MIESEAIVLRAENEHAWVRIRPHTPCGNCDPETGCKTVAMTRLFSGRNQEFRVLNPITAQTGDLVQVAIAEGLLLKSALWGYGLPLGLLLAGAAAGHFIFAQPFVNIATLAGAVLGVAIALLLLKNRNRPHGNEPVIVAKREPGLPMLSSCRSKANKSAGDVNL